LLLSIGIAAQAQSTAQTPTTPTGRQFSKNIVQGIFRHDSIPITRMWATSLVIPGYAQLYNRQYWKLPVLYGVTGGLLAGGYLSNLRYMDVGDEEFRVSRDWCYLAAGVSYWTGILDGLMSYERKDMIPQRATILSLMFPGLGQFYIQEYWTIPIVYFGFAFGAYMIGYNNLQYERFRSAYNVTVENDKNQDKSDNQYHELYGRMTAENMQYYRDSFRRSRDYAILLTALLYVLNAVHANVFAHLHDFDVSDNLSFNIRPTVLYDNMLASHAQIPDIGMKLNITF
jgi:TM2 domain-containing membrane protein YozV